MGNLVIVSHLYLSDLAKIYVIIWGIFNITPVKKKNIYIIIGISASILLPMMATQYSAHSEAVALISAVMVTLTIGAIFQGKFFRVLTNTLLAYILVFLLDAAVAAIVTLILNSTYYELGDSVLMNLVINSINILTIGSVVFIIRRIRKSKITIHISKRIYTLLFSGTGTGLIILCGLIVRKVNGTSELARKVMVVVTIVVVIAYCTACITMIAITESRDSYRALSLINQSVIEAQQKYYLLVNEKQQEIRGIRHDIKNHIACISSLYHSGNYKELEDYLKQLEEEINSPQELFTTGNDIVDAILNDAQSKFSKERIKIIFNGGFPEELHIAPLDLCVIFANTISNAVEAILRMKRDCNETSNIEIQIKSFKEDIFIDVINPVDHEVMINPGEIVTSKEDKARHGFGIKNVRQRVEKYHGTVNYHSENGLFYVEINIKNKV